jgi:hypothetical protein
MLGKVECVLRKQQFCIEQASRLREEEVWLS